MQSEQNRTVNAGIALYIPEDVIQIKRKRYLRDGKIVHRPELMNDSEYDIIHRYQWEDRGLVEYYGMAQNLAKLSYIKYTMATSLLKTFAGNNKTTLMKTLKRLEAVTKTPNGPRKSLKLTIQREGKTPLVAIFGGLSLARKDTVIRDQVLMPYARMRSEIVERLLKDTCEVCDSKEHVHMHHVRHLADLNKKGHREKPFWMKIRIARKRKSIPLCKRCHDDIHSNRPKFRK